MNANINYDEIPDTSAVQEDLLAALSSQHVTVHTNEEPLRLHGKRGCGFCGQEPAQ